MAELRTRDSSIDLIKAFAIVGVLVIHVVSSVLTQMQVGSFEWMSGLFWGSMVRASVPLFLMTSGAIMLNPEKKLSLKKLYFHNIARIIAAMLVWGFAYKIYHLWRENQLNFSMVWYSFKRLLLFDQEFHFYYIHMILLVYVFLPITRHFAEKADKKLLEYALCIWLILAILYPTLRAFSPFILLSGLTGQWAINLSFAGIGYGLLGYYLKKYPLSLRKGVLCSVAGFLVTFGMTLYLSLKSNALNEIFLQGTSIGVCLLSVGIFAISSFVKCENVMKKAVTCLSKASFCIYLSHMFVLYLFTHIGLTVSVLSPILSVPLISAAVLFVSFIIYIVLSKIPVLRNWII